MLQRRVSCVNTIAEDRFHCCRLPALDNTKTKFNEEFPMTSTLYQVLVSFTGSAASEDEIDALTAAAIADRSGGYVTIFEYPSAGDVAEFIDLEDELPSLVASETSPVTLRGHFHESTGSVKFSQTYNDTVSAETPEAALDMFLTNFDLRHSGNFELQIDQDGEMRTVKVADIGATSAPRLI
jgi:hypothetical protein